MGPYSESAVIQNMSPSLRERGGQRPVAVSLPVFFRRASTNDTLSDPTTSLSLAAVMLVPKLVLPLLDPELELLLSRLLSQISAYVPATQASVGSEKEQ
jgi:hypothetical protein